MLRTFCLQDPMRGNGSCGVFVARNRMAVLEKSGPGNISVLNLGSQGTKKIPVPLVGTDTIFAAGLGNVLCKAEDKVCG